METSVSRGILQKFRILALSSWKHRSTLASHNCTSCNLVNITVSKKQNFNTSSHQCIPSLKESWITHSQCAQLSRTAFSNPQFDETFVSSIGQRTQSFHNSRIIAAWKTRGKRESKKKFNRKEKSKDEDYFDENGVSKNDTDVRLDGGESVVLETEEDLRRLAERVVQEAGQRDVMVLAVPISRVEELLLSLSHLDLPMSHVVATLTSNPSLLADIKTGRLISNLHLLRSMGLHSSRLATILARFPPLARISGGAITSAAEELRKVGFNQQSIVKVLVGHPQLMDHGVWKGIGGRVVTLRELFTAADVWTIVAQCPSVLTQPWEDINARFEYAFMEMGVSPKQMAYARLFSHPLSHLRTRHMLLFRAGLFSHAKRRQGEPNPNPALDEIMAPDAQFCRSFGFPLEELRAFALLYGKEMGQEVEGETDSDDELIER